MEEDDVALGIQDQERMQESTTSLSTMENTSLKIYEVIISKGLSESVYKEFGNKCYDGQFVSDK